MKVVAQVAMKDFSYFSQFQNNKKQE
jgi:hypothetical protein